jgi:hypothetical protein
MSWETMKSMEPALFSLLLEYDDPGVASRKNDKAMVLVLAIPMLTVEDFTDHFVLS